MVVVVAALSYVVVVLASLLVALVRRGCVVGVLFVFVAKVVVALRRAVGVLSVSLSVLGHVVVVCFVVCLVLLVWFGFAHELLRPPLVGGGGVVVQRVVAALVVVFCVFRGGVGELALVVLVGCAAPVLVVVSSCSCSLVFCECCIGATIWFYMRKTSVEQTCVKHSLHILAAPSLSWWLGCDVRILSRGCIVDSGWCMLVVVQCAVDW